jgi:hypothetical protein
LKYRSLDPVRQRLASQALQDFVWTEEGGIPSIVQFLNQWAQLGRERPDMLLIVRYEDFSMHRGNLQGLAGLWASRAEAEIRDAVEFAF